MLVALGSPWVEGKALATASPAIPFAAMIAIARAGDGRPGARRPDCSRSWSSVGSSWSNALGYGGVSLAPHGQLAELEEIGERIAGQGPALMTEYEPYGVRHFLRDADPEGISELRRRTIPLLDGTLVEKGESADTDMVDPAALAAYRTLVLRRSPAQSRPPAAVRADLAGRLLRGLAAPGGRDRAAGAAAARRRRRPVRRPRLRGRARGSPPRAI